MIAVSGGAADSWQVKGSDGVICLLLNGTFKFTIQYPNATGHVSLWCLSSLPRLNSYDSDVSCL